MTRHARDPAASVCAVLAGMLALSLALGGAKPVAAAATLEELAAPLNIDPTFITVSGISSGHQVISLPCRLTGTPSTP